MAATATATGGGGSGRGAPGVIPAIRRATTIRWRASVAPMRWLMPGGSRSVEDSATGFRRRPNGSMRRVPGRTPPGPGATMPARPASGRMSAIARCSGTTPDGPGPSIPATTRMSTPHRRQLPHHSPWPVRHGGECLGVDVLVVRSRVSGGELGCDSGGRNGVVRGGSWSNSPGGRDRPGDSRVEWTCGSTSSAFGWPTTDSVCAAPGSDGAGQMFAWPVRVRTAVAAMSPATAARAMRIAGPRAAAVPGLQIPRDPESRVVAAECGPLSAALRGAQIRRRACP